MTRPVLSALLLAPLFALAWLAGGCPSGEPLARSAPSGQPLPQAKIDFVQGFGARSHVSNTAWQKNREKNFPTADLGFYPRYPDHDGWPLLDRNRTLECVRRADIFLFSGHSGVPSSGPARHVIQVANPTGTGRANITADDLRSALQGRPGPRLVVINGCSTTDPLDGVPESARLPTGFGISRGTRGRAYLGWSLLVVGPTADNHVGRLFQAWTTMSPDGVYPTLADAHAAGKAPRTLVIVGDGGLRYKTAYRLESDGDPKVKVEYPLRVFLDSTGPRAAQLTVDFGAANEPLLKRLGASRFVELKGDWQANRYSFREGAFKALVERLFRALSPESTVTVHEATLTARPDGERLRVTLRLHVVSQDESGGVRRKPETLREEFRLVGTPERPGGR